MARAAVAGVTLGLAVGCAAILGIDDVGYGTIEDGGSDGLVNGDGPNGQDGDAPCQNVGDIRCNGTCVNPTSTSQHCGRCGYDCAGPCQSSKCQEVILATDLAGPHGIAVDGAFAYVTLFGPSGFDPDKSPGSVVRLPISGLPKGTAPDTLQSNLAEPAFIVVTNGRLAWTARDGVASSLLDGGSVSTIGDAGRHFGLVEANGELYAISVYNKPCNLLRWTPPASTPSFVVTANCGRMIITDDGSLFWTNFAGQEGTGISQRSLANVGIPVVPFIGAANTWGIAADKEFFYYTEDANLAAVRSIARDGGQETTLAVNLRVPRVILVDGDSLYVGENQGGDVVRISLDGGAQDGSADGGAPANARETIGSGNGATGMTLAGDFLYWVNFGDVKTGGFAIIPGDVRRVRVR